MRQLGRMRQKMGRALAWVCVLAFVGAVVAPQFALAQTKPQPPARAPAKAPAPAKTPAPVEAEPAPVRPMPPGYEPDLLRLSEVMGALSFLRTLCGAPDASEWRGRMSALVNSEARDAETRARLAGAFNQGYNGFAITYRTCTPAAQMAASRYLEEGERLSRAIAARFGG